MRYASRASLRVVAKTAAQQLLLLEVRRKPAPNPPCNRCRATATTSGTDASLFEPMFPSLYGAEDCFLKRLCVA